MATVPSESAQTDRRTADIVRAGVKPSEVPAPPLTVVERDAVDFLANVYKVAAARNATRYLPAWMAKYRERSKIVHGAGREPLEFLPDEATTDDVTTAQRRNVLRIVASQTGQPNEPTSSTADVLRLVSLYERAHDVGMQAIERLAKNWMLAALQQHAQGQAQFLIQANSKRNTLQWAAMYIEGRVARQLATVKDPDLYRVLYPKNRRPRHGDLDERIRRVQYILAMREVLSEVLNNSAASPELVRRQQSRGLSPTSLNRQTERAEVPVPIPKDASLLAALQFFNRIKWHPHFGSIVGEWKKDSAGGFHKLEEAVNEALKANADLTKRLMDEPSRVWAFRAAVQQSIGGIDISDADSLLKYAFVYASTVKTPLEEVLETIGVITTLLATFGGPAAPVGIVADAVVQGASAALSFLRQIDQDDAEAATIFEKDTDRLSEGGYYLAPIVQGVGALAAAAAVPHALKDILNAERSAAGIGLRARPAEPELLSSSKVREARAELDAKIAADLTEKETIKEPDRLVGSKGTETSSREVDKKIELAAPKKKDFRDFLEEVKQRSSARARESKTEPIYSIYKGKPVNSLYEEKFELYANANRSRRAEGSTNASGNPKTSERMTERLRLGESSVADVDTVPNLTQRQELRLSLERKIEELGVKSRQLSAEKGQIGRELKSIYNRLKVAEERKQVEEVARLKNQQSILLEEWKSIGDVGDLILQKQKLKQLLDRTDREYYKALTNAASKEPEYIAVRSGKPGNFFLPIQGEREVEHIYPRSRIFMTKGFEKLDWSQQKFLFNYRKNLEVVSAEFNLGRSNVPYASLKREFWSKFIKDEASLAKLANLENEVKLDVEKLIQHPRDAALWRKALLGESL